MFDFNPGHIKSSSDSPTSFSKSEEVRVWRVMSALHDHWVGDSRVTTAQLDAALKMVLGKVRDFSICLEYVPADGVRMDIPPINDRLHLQALIYWCAEFNCSLDHFLDAYASAGSRALVHDVYLNVCEFKRRDSLLGGWIKTLHLPTATPVTVPI